MSWAMRILLIIGSVVTAIYVLKKIRRSKMRTEDSVFWLFFSLILVLLGVFPNIAIKFSEWIGVQSAANLVFLVMIFLLIVKVFSMEQQIARLQQQVKNTVQRVAIEGLERDKNTSGTTEAKKQDN